jgi:indole-3-acetate monooxygenase
MPASQPLELARTIATLAGECAEAGERDRKLAPGVVEALIEAGFFRLCVPASVGGGEADVATTVAVCEELARGDAAAGWCIAVMSTAGMLAAYIPQDAARRAYGDERAVVGGVFAPKGRAVVDGERYRVTGRWPFSSGVDHCTWVMGGCVVVEDDSPRMLEGGRPDVELVLFPKEGVEVIDTWNVAGLRGTGSHDIAVEDLAVPREYAASVITRKPREPGALYAFPPFGLLALTIAGTALGIGRAAIEDLVELAGGKTPTGSRRLLAERATVQSETAQAQARLCAARAFLYGSIAEAWDSAVSRGEVSIQQRASLRLAAAHAAVTGADVVTTAFRLGGGTAIYERSPLQRRLRDAHVITQHMLVAPATFELTGRLLLGVPTDTTQL